MARRQETLGSTARVIRRALHDFRRDLALTWSYGGWREIREAFLQRAVYRLYRRRTALLFEEDVTRVSQVRLPAGVEVRVLGDRDWASITGALTTRVLKRFRRNLTPWNTCLVAWRGERPVGYTWFSEPGATVEELPLRLPPDAAYGWDLWVDPRERRRGVGSALVRARLAYARERGFVRAWRIVIDSNLPALRTIERGGVGDARVLGKVVYVTLLGRMRARYVPSETGRAPASSARAISRPASSSRTSG